MGGAVFRVTSFIPILVLTITWSNLWRFLVISFSLFDIISLFGICGGFHSHFRDIRRFLVQILMVIDQDIVILIPFLVI